VTKGWVEIEYEDIGRVRLEKGSMAYRSPTTRRSEVVHGDDVVILEVLTPTELQS
jgi:hypothetical protein